VARDPGRGRPILLDACCLINLAATARIEELLQSIARPVWIADHVYCNEALYLRRGGEAEAADAREVIELEPLRDTGVIDVVSAETDAELATFITLALDLDDGEALTAALAIHRGADVATDDRKGIRVLTAAGPAVRIWRTSELIKAWAERHAIPPALLRDVLAGVQDRARFRPGRGEPLREWWEGVVGN
jgi:predicted nucleic acid-binding protein